jgi:TRAP transporter TAXI family solute receptor
MGVLNGLKTWLFLVVLAVAVCACAQGDQKRKSIYYEDGNDVKKPAEGPNTIKIATGQEGGTYFATGKALGLALSKEVNRTIEVIETEGSVENVEGVNNLDFDLGIVQADFLDFNYGRKNYDKFKVVGAMYHEPVFVLVRRKLQLSSIGELRGNSVAIGLEKSGTQHTSQTLLGIFGISLDEADRYAEDYGATAKLFGRGKVDAAFIVSAWIPKGLDRLLVVLRIC